MAAYAADSEAIGKRARPRERHFMGEKFERHKQAWTSEEVQKLHTLAKKGMPLRAIAKALTRSEESVKTRAKLDKLGIAALR
jgi:DNA-binding NarL/FixJ family response regulator